MPTKNEILAVLSPHNDRILSTHQDALEHFLRKYNDDRVALSNRTLANIWRDLLVYYARDHFDGLESIGVRCYDHRNTFFVEFDGMNVGKNVLITARFKKVNRKFLTANIPTEAANNFNAQAPPKLNGINWDGYFPTNVNFAHLPNDFRTAYEGVYVTKPDGNKAIAWYAELSDESSASRIVTLPVQTEITSRAGRVRAKAVNASQDKKTASNQ